ncbi:MAG: NlpC/P60 family protein [Pseudomonadota bacterium]
MTDLVTIEAPPSRERALAEARRWLGTPYVHQASARSAGCDCLGLIRGVYRGLYGGEPEAPPPYTPDWNERAYGRGEKAEPLLEAARRTLDAVDVAAPGDVLVFRVMREGPAKHCGILSAHDRFIHAYAGRCVVESWLGRWWRNRLVAAFSFPGAVPGAFSNKEKTVIAEKGAAPWRNSS